MSSNGKNNKNNKKYIFKEGSNPLFPISNNLPNYLSYYSNIKINKKKYNKNSKILIIDNRNSNLQHKKCIENYSSNKNINKINNTYSSSRPKDDIKQLKLTNLSFSKIKNLDFSSSVGDIRYQEKNKNNMNNIYNFNLNDNKNNEKRINLEINNSALKEHKNNLNIISPIPKYLGDSLIFNNNKSNIYSLRKPNINKNKIEFSHTNYIINDIFPKCDIKNNPNLANQIKIAKNYLLTDINTKNKNTSNMSNVKLIFNNKNINDKSATHDTPILIKRKESPLFLAKTNPGNLKCSFEKNKKMNAKGPEDLHFYYITMIQEGKKKEVEFKD